eukprot:scaffold223140_cov21-Tisochrysis_lutea.AAC.1
MGCACWPHPAGVDHSRDECDEEYGLIQQMLATMVWSAFAGVSGLTLQNGVCACILLCICAHMLCLHPSVYLPDTSFKPLALVLTSALDTSFEQCVCVCV